MLSNTNLIKNFEKDKDETPIPSPNYINKLTEDLQKNISVKENIFQISYKNSLNISNPKILNKDEKENEIVLDNININSSKI